MCTVVCPKHIKVTEAILRTKKKIIQEQQPKEQQRERVRWKLRKEIDPLGERAIPKNAYFGIQTFEGDREFSG